MAGLKEVKSKISGVKKTAQITKAMNMVASAKLRGAQNKMEAFRPYAEKFSATMQNLSSGMETTQQPLMEVRTVTRAEIIVVSSDRGLCGSFNGNIFKEVDHLIAKYQAQDKIVSLICVGRKGYQHYAKTGLVRKFYDDLMSSFQMFDASEIAKEVVQNFCTLKTDSVDLAYGKFFSIGVQKPQIESFLPIQALSSAIAPKQKSGSYSYEPEPEEILATLLPLFLNVRLYQSMLEVGVSEQAARMTAMDNATTACKDIIKDLTLVYNKARQAAITGELMDIVGGAEALKG